ncbi:MAG: hypothetical protein PHR68_05470, partial [Candidatus Gracilibacteria bacterium]|nr:hypothetical protein [Candidatus Gracilibacteria bacterium]
LRTIGFMSFSSYVSDARDTNRVVTIKSIQSGLDMYSTLKSSLPTPDNALTLSGGTGVYIKQGTIGKSVSSTIKLTNEVKDPKTNKEYVYSISGNGNYYQIGADLENAISYNDFTNQAYAEQTKAYVKGNYAFDPSLPSLITITGSVNTNSGIFDPNVCFVIDGGTNLVTSSSGTCTSKYKMNLKDFDSSLVGYWDMESLTGTKLKDLSGNGNNGTFSGNTVNMNYLNSLTGGTIGKALRFNGNTDYIEIPDSQSLKLSKTATFISNVKILGNSLTPGCESTYGTILAKRLWRTNITDYMFYIYPDQKYFFTYNNENNTIWYPRYKINYISELGKYITYTTTYNNGIVKNYMNGIFVTSSIVDYGKSDIGTLPNSNGTMLIGSKLGNCVMNGIIDDIKIYNRALSDSEIAQQAKIAGF